MPQNRHSADEMHSVLHGEIAVLLRQTRILCGITQQDLAAQTDITYQQLQKYENGKSRITAVRLHQILNILNVSYSEFFNRLPSAPSGQIASLPDIDDTTLKICRQLMKVEDNVYKERIKEAVFCLTA